MSSSSSRTEQTVSGRLRRYHRLTDAGAQVLAEDAERLARQAAVALERLKKRGAPRASWGGGAA